eukprot:1586712-Karenia_brevis.AAC.1
MESCATPLPWAYRLFSPTVYCDLCGSSSYKFYVHKINLSSPPGPNSTMLPFSTTLFTASKGFETSAT